MVGIDQPRIHHHMRPIDHIIRCLDVGSDGFDDSIFDKNIHLLQYAVIIVTGNQILYIFDQQCHK